MNTLATTKLSSKGQVVIPETIRNQMGLHTGDQFFVVAENDVVVLKVLQQPDLSAYDALIQAARKKAAIANLTEEDLEQLIKDVKNK